MALDPSEQHLRHVEKDILIPKIMREKARERCSEQVQGPREINRRRGARKGREEHLQRCFTASKASAHTDFTKCCKDSGLLMIIKCRKENSSLKECLTSYYNDPAFYEECKVEYLKEREEFRKTGIPSKKRLQKLPTSM